MPWRACLELYERSEECALHNSYEPMEEEKCASPGAFISKVDGSISTSPVAVVSKATSQYSHEVMCAMRSERLRNGSW